MKARLACAAIMLAALSTVASAVPPTREELAQWCGEAEDMAHCGRLIEQQQMKRLPGLAKREGVNLRIALFPAGTATFADVENPLPVCSAPQGVARFLGFALALDAHRGVRQGLQPGHGNPFAAAFTQAVIAVPHPFQGDFNVGKLAAFDFGQLRADFVLGGVHRGVEHVAGSLLAELAEGAEVAG